jgi:hypothetical protein
MKQSDSLPKPNSASEQDSAKDKSDEKLQHYLSALKTEDYSQTFPRVEQWLYRTNNKLEIKRKEKTMQKIKEYFAVNKLRLVYPVIALAILIGACTMPVTQTENAGYMMSWTVAKNDAAAQDKINSLGWLKNAQVTQNENTNNGVTEILYTAVLKNITEQQADAYSKELQSAGKLTSLKVTPINYDVKRPLYSAALHSVFSINIDATGMTDEQLQAEIQRKLKEQGVDMQVNVKTDADGRREMKMTMNNEGKEPKNFELNVNDGNNVEKMKVIHRDNNDMARFKGKSDEEIRKMVREEVGNPNLKDGDIKISRENDDVKIKIETSIQDVKPRKEK